MKGKNKEWYLDFYFLLVEALEWVDDRVIYQDRAGLRNGRIRWKGEKQIKQNKQRWHLHTQKSGRSVSHRVTDPHRSVCSHASNGNFRKASSQTRREQCRTWEHCDDMRRKRSQSNWEEPGRKEGKIKHDRIVLQKPRNKRFCEMIMGLGYRLFQMKTGAGTVI